MTTPRPMLALVHGVRAGDGGLGLQAATAAAGLVRVGRVRALGRGRTPTAPFVDAPEIDWEVAPPVFPAPLVAASPYRWLRGAHQLAEDGALGRWVESRLERVDGLYTFTQVGLEALRWARAHGVRTVLDNPNGHLAGFRRVLETQARAEGLLPLWEHPTPEMVSRVEQEYALADAIRVSSQWAKRSMVEAGVSAEKIEVVEQPVDLVRFQPPGGRAPARGPLRLVFVGSLDLRKGFHLLLRAIRLAGPDRFSLRIVGATGSRAMRRLLERESEGLQVEVAPGDPRPAYHQGELVVLPSLEDGFGFVVAEGMACGLPALVTDACGSQEWVEPGSGWVVRAGEAEALAEGLEQAHRAREALGRMGLRARQIAEQRGGPATIEALARWLRSVWGLR